MIFLSTIIKIGIDCLFIINLYNIFSEKIITSRLSLVLCNLDEYDDSFLDLHNIILRNDLGNENKVLIPRNIKIGSIGLNKTYDDNLEIIIDISKEYRGQGYGYEAMVSYLKSCLSYPAYKKIINCVIDSNEESINFHEKLPYSSKYKTECCFYYVFDDKSLEKLLESERLGFKYDLSKSLEERGLGA